jgi:hypothetical protein
MEEHPDTPVVQMDSVEGRKAERFFDNIFYPVGLNADLP